MTAAPTIDEAWEGSPVIATGAFERRLRRLRLDLHDGPLQDVVALGVEIDLLREQLAPILPESRREPAVARLNDLLARVSEVYRELGELSRSLEPRSLADSAFLPALEAEVDAFTAESGIDVKLDVRGDFDVLSDSQRIALLQVTREALSNAREHSGASLVHVAVETNEEDTRLHVRDNGCGFDMPTTLTRAAEGGRLGLRGMAERIELLGGRFRLRTQPGGPTEISATIPLWRGDSA
jgi:two-component system sensor histidine kinase DegS